MKIESIECTSMEKGTAGGKQEFVLKITTSDAEYDIVRTYSTFFDFKARITKTSGKVIPELPGGTWFERRKGDEKKKKQMTDFCKAILGLPEEISQGEDVHQFFSKWPNDACISAMKDLKSEDEKRKSSGEGSKKKKLTKQKSNENRTSGALDLMAELKKTVADGPSKRVSSGAKLSDSSGKKNGNSRALPQMPSLDDKLPLEKTKSDDSPECMVSKYIVIADHKPEQDDELELTQGDVVTVTEKLFLGWWLVQHDKNEGWAPAAKLQAVDEHEDEKDQADTEAELTDVCPVYEAISDFVARSPDEVSYVKNQKVEVLVMQNDGWWKVRSKETGKVGMTPGVNLARLSDGSQSGDPLYSDISAYSQQSVYKKRTPPRRNSSHRMSLSEIYAQVEIKAKTKPPVPPKKIPEDDEDDDDDLYLKKPKPAVPPKKLGLSDLNYCEIEFSQDKPPQQRSCKLQPPMLKVIEQTNSVTYSDVEVAPVSPKPKLNGQNVPSRVQPPSPKQSAPMKGYMNVARGPEKDPPAEKFYRLLQDYSPTMTHVEGLPANKDDIVKALSDDATKIDATNVFCLMCLKEQEETKPCEGWIPKHYLTEVQVEVTGHDAHGVPIVTVIDEAEETSENLYLPVISSVKDPRKPGWRTKDYRKADWFAGTMSRAECEAVMKDAKPGQFLVREKSDEHEPFSISVAHDTGMKHFKIVKEGEGKFAVGGHVFKNVSHIIRHYSKSALFLGNDKKEEKLGKPFIIPKQKRMSKPKQEP